MELVSESSQGSLRAAAGGKLFLSAPSPSTTLLFKPLPASTLAYGLADPDRPALEQVSRSQHGSGGRGGRRRGRGGALAGAVTRLPLGP